MDGGILLAGGRDRQGRYLSLAEVMLFSKRAIEKRPILLGHILK
jgi:hypothetical protein